MNGNRYEFYLGTRVVFGCGVVAEVGGLIQERFGVRSVYIVTDPGVRRAGLLKKVEDSLNTAGIHYSVFEEVLPNPTIENVEAGLTVLPGDCGVIVAVGGGSPIDVAKAIAVVATNGGSIKDYEGMNKVKKPKLPVVAVPTTAGTGSEVTASAVITDRTRQRKMAIISQFIPPELAVVDPLLTVSIPPALTASTGMDALTHAIEAYVSRAAMPMTDALALYSIRLIGKNLRRAVFCGGDLSARENMMMASLMAGAAFANARLGLVHAMAHPLGGVFNMPHGVANAILLPYVMRFNALASPAKFKDIAEALGERVDCLSEREAALKAVEAVVKLASDIGIPRSLKEVNISEEQIKKLVEETMVSGNVRVNPRQVTEEDVERLYREAIEGTL